MEGSWKNPMNSQREHANIHRKPTETWPRAALLQSKNTNHETTVTQKLLLCSRSLEFDQKLTAFDETIRNIMCVVHFLTVLGLFRFSVSFCPAIEYYNDTKKPFKNIQQLYDLSHKEDGVSSSTVHWPQKKINAHQNNSKAFYSVFLSSFSQDTCSTSPNTPSWKQQKDKPLGHCISNPG